MPPNPYAPPAAEGDPAEPVGADGIPQGAIRLARLWLVGGVIAFALGGAAALFMRVELLDPRPTFQAATYTRALLVHGIAMIAGVMVPALFGGIGYVFVADAMRARNGPSFRVGVGAWLAWIVGVVALVAYARTSEPMGFDPITTPPLLVVCVIALALAVAIVAVQHAAVVRAGWADAAPATRVAVVGFVASIGALPPMMFAMLSYATFFALTPIAGCNAVAAIAVTLHVVARARERPAWPTLLAIVLVSTFAAEMLGPESPILAGTGSSLAGVVAAIAQLVLALVLVIRVLRSSERFSPALVYVLLGTVPALVIGGPVQAFLGSLSVDLHLHDTYFIVGEEHATAYLTVFAILVAMHAWGGELFGRDAQPMLARIGALFVCGGSLRMIWAMLSLGHDGMPRRYFTYIDTFEPLHRMTTTAALATALGFAFVLLAWLLGRRRA